MVDTIYPLSILIEHLYELSSYFKTSYDSMLSALQCIRDL